MDAYNNGGDLEVNNMFDPYIYKVYIIWITLHNVKTGIFNEIHILITGIPTVISIKGWLDWSPSITTVLFQVKVINS